MDRELVEFRPQIYTVLPAGTTDERLVELWLHGLAATTQESYQIDVRAFFAFVQKPLREVNLADLQGFANNLADQGYTEATIARRLRAVKSLFTFGSKTRYLAFNMGAAMKVPKVRRRLHERILTREQVLQMFVCEKNARNRLILRMLYYSGMRVSELCGLCWKDLYPGPNGTGIVAIFGKGGKERHVALKREVYEEFLSFRNGAGSEDPVFVSRGGGRGHKKGGGHFDKTQVERIVQQAAQKAGVKKRVTPHYLRHSHATHAALNKAPAAVVKETLGHESLETTMLYFDISPEESSSFYL
jgi:integrase/recombinase XerD